MFQTLPNDKIIFYSVNHVVKNEVKKCVMEHLIF
jgi:hypothetical protein